eukprot:2345015-Alexandrium_andersonii.AAC.1
MSASLVGSEMCIRDRPPEKAQETAGSAGAQWLLPIWARLYKKAASKRTCLLYTSDAADDM